MVVVSYSHRSGNSLMRLAKVRMSPVEKHFIEP